MNWFLPGQSRSMNLRRRARPARARRRVPGLEQLENRSLLAVLPYGAMPDDTGEYLLGDVIVNVVFMESDPTMSPGDNNPAPQGRGSPAENWATNTIDTIANVKQKIQDGLDWWEDTLAQSLVGTPAAGRDLLNFTIDWTYANNPIRTGYEPIARTSNDFALWMYDFLNVVGFNQTGNFSSDIRAYNNFKRDGVSQDYDWSFTIFVVNDEVDADNAFAAGGQFSRAFSFAGGRFMIVPASRPASTFAHEAAHAFWALDEYAGTTANYLTRRGYYNTPNSNHASNPDPLFVQEDSIMANDPARENAWLGNVTSTSSREMLGWKDSDGDGLFDVLDVPFLLEGIGRYDSSLEEYLFTGFSSVDTLPNQNTSGLQNDITINQIREVQYSVDEGPWTTIQTLPARTYLTELDLSIPVPAGNHTVKIRTIDTRTGAMSPEFVGSTSEPTQSPKPGLSGFVYEDEDGSGSWDSGEQPLPDWALVLVDEFGEEVNLVRRIEPSQFAELALLNNVNSEALLTAVGSEVSNNEVRARTTSKVAGAGKVFANNSIVLGNNIDTWNASRQLRIDFPTAVSSLSIRAYSATSGAGFARLEVYNSAGELLDRQTTSALSSAGATLSLSRLEGDIAYALVRGHAGTDVVLDTLQWGAAASATTNSLGAYSLAGLAAGTYYLRVDLPPLHFLTTFPSNIVELTLSAGEALGGINFGIVRAENLWHNFANALNVSNDPQGDISPVDALLVINWLNSHTAAELPGAATPEIHGFVDVNNDGYCTALDALLVINHLNAPPSSFLPSGPGEGEATWLAPPDHTPAEGESAPLNAAEYYARQPLHFLSIPGDDEICIHEDDADHDHGHEVEDDHDLYAPPISALTSSGPDLDAFFVLETESLINPLRSLSTELADEVEFQLGQQLTRDALQPVLDRLRRAAGALDEAADELDEALDSIAPDVADGWQVALARLLARLPRGLG